MLANSAQTGRPLSAAAHVFGGSSMATIVSVGALLSAFGYFAATMIATPRITFAFAEQGDFPRWFAAIHRRYHTPYVSIVAFPLIAMAFLCTTRKRLGLILLSLSMFASLLFGLYHHFLAVRPDHIRSKPPSPWGMTFVLTAYLLLITEAIGTYVGVHFLWIAKESFEQSRYV